MKIISVVFFLIFSFSVYAQTVYQNTYSNFYKLETGGVAELPNGELIITGNIYDSLTQKSDILLLNVQSDGSINWSKQYGVTENEYIKDIALTSDNHILMVGETFSFGNNSRDILILKTDLNGDTTWVKHIPMPGEDVGYHIFEDSSGDYVIGGYTNSTGTGQRDMLVVKLDINGNLLWTKTYGSAATELLHHISEREDGSYILTGTTEEGQTSKYGAVLAIDSNGSLLWQKSFGGTQDDYLFWSEARMDSSIYVGGYTSSFGFGALDANLMKLDYDGNLVWSKVYGTNHIDFATTYTSTSDGGVLFAGGEDFFTFKTDSNGTLLWNNQFKIRDELSPYRDLPEEVMETSDGNYLVLGKYREFISNDTDIYIAKVGTSGTPPCKGQDGRANEMTISPTVINTTLIENTSSLMIQSVGLNLTSPSLVLNEICSVSSQDIIKEKLKVFPNPATNYLNIEVPNGLMHSASLFIYDVRGQLVKSINDYDFSLIDVSDFSVGMYFIEIHTGDTIYNGKVIIE